MTIALGMTGNRADAEDLVQTAFIHALQRGSAPMHAPLNWFRKVMRNIRIDQHRWATRNFAAPAHRDEINNQPFWHEQTPEALLIQAEQDRRMAALINCARPRHRQTIRLTYIEGLTQGEAARRLRVSTGTIKSQLHRGLADIRRAVCES